MTTDLRALGHISNDPEFGTMQAELLRALERVKPESVRIATAYLTPDGFDRIRIPMEPASDVKLMLGERPFLTPRGPRDTLAKGSDDDELFGPDEAIKWYRFLEGDYPWLLLTHQQRKELLEDNPDAVKQHFNLESWRKVQALVRFLQREGVEVRRYLGDKAGKVADDEVLSSTTSASVHLHAKAYIFSGADEVYAAVGSSNLTGGGLTQNVELNVTTHDPQFTGELTDWFETKWTQSQTCTAEFIRLLERCVLFGPRFRPWQVFIKALHAAYGRFLDFGLGADVAEQLAIFQQEAVARCVSLVERHWGVMLCDSVGLGKTHEGLGILEEFQQRRGGKSRALVVCPAQLEDNWSAEKLRAHGINGETITMESLPQLADLDETEGELEKSRRRRLLSRYQQFDIILVDESHNFRNHQTKRYRALMDIIRGGNPEKRVVLLTATPINNSVWDLYHQLSLISRGDDTWYAGRGPIANLVTTFRNIEKQGGGAGLLDAMMLSMVRRTRHDIRARQESGEPMRIGEEDLKFPQHEIPEAITYSLESLYGGIYKQVIDTIQGLNFAVYRLEEYGVDTGEKDTDERVKQRNASFVGIMKTIFLKRMESSVAALVSTVRSAVDYENFFLARLDEGKVLTPKLAQRLKVTLGGSLPDDEQDVDEVGGAGGAVLERMPLAPVDADKKQKLAEDVTADRDKLAALLGVLEDLEDQWEKDGDPKLNQLRALLNKLPARDAHGVSTKAVIFTNYRDTADYLFRSLGGPTRADFAGKLRCASNLDDHRAMSILTGTDDRKRRNEVLAHFAPLAVHRESEPLDDPNLQERIKPLREEGIELLIATDVLSEGQNLQDAQYLVNYDLHWNPVRMIQRGGRIDRLFSPHDHVYFYNIMPEKELEALLGLVKRLTKKIESIENAVALDASVLGEQIEGRAIDQLMAIKRGGEEADKIYKEGERTQGLEQAYAELNRYIEMIRNLGTEDVKKIPDGVYSVKVGDDSGVFVQLRMPEDAGGEVFWRFYPLAEQTPLSSPSEIVPLLEAERDDPRAELPEQDNPFQYLELPLRAAVSQLGQDYKEQQNALRPDAFLKALGDLLLRDDLLEAEPELFAQLQKWRSEYHPLDFTQRGRVADTARTLRLLDRKAPLDDLVARLKDFWAALEESGLDRPLPRPETREPSEEDLELVCWELVLTKQKLRELTETGSRS